MHIECRITNDEVRMVTVRGTASLGVHHSTFRVRYSTFSVAQLSSSSPAPELQDAKLRPRRWYASPPFIGQCSRCETEGRRRSVKRMGKAGALPPRPPLPRGSGAC